MHWSYDGRYLFVSNNCAVETGKLLQEGVPRWADPGLNRLSPGGLLRRLERQGRADGAVLDDRREAMRLGYYFPSAQAHYQQLFDDYQYVARRSLLSGLHVHVEVPAELDRIRVMNEVLPWTPLLLALSCSSPFWQGEDSGFASYRQTACDEWPRMGVPEYLEDQRAYDDYVSFLIANGAMNKASGCWWGVRPSSSYPTLELRMTDACPRLNDALSLASLFRVLVAYAIAKPRAGADYSATSRWILMENRWRAKRSGINAMFLMEGFDRAFTLEQWLFMAEQVLGETARSLSVEDVFDALRHIIREGSSAGRQRVVYQASISSGRQPREALSQVVDHLLMETASAQQRDMRQALGNSTVKVVP